MLDPAGSNRHDFISARSAEDNESNRSDWWLVHLIVQTVPGLYLTPESWSKVMIVYIKTWLTWQFPSVGLVYPNDHLLKCKKTEESNPDNHPEL